MGLRTESGPTGPTKARRDTHCSGAEEDVDGGGTPPGAAIAMAGNGGTNTSELLSKARLRPRSAPPSLASTEDSPNLGPHHPDALPPCTGGDAEALTGDTTVPPRLPLPR
jgi:hypothetical protein